MLGIGYVSHRNDGMSELRINGFKQVEKKHLWGPQEGGKYLYVFKKNSP